MKSQVNALLHVLQGLHLDVLAAYPALKCDLSKDFGRIALLCRDRGLGIFTLDLPHLESLLLAALESGRLDLNGPLSTRVSKRVRVPRLYSGLWLRVFDSNACLKHAEDVDVTALAFLRQLLTLGKKLEVECSFDRVQATVGAYHDIERQLRLPNLNWFGDDIGLSRGERIDLVDHSHRSDGYLQYLQNQEIGEEVSEENVYKGWYRHLVPPMHLNIVQALRWEHDSHESSLPLFSGLESTNDEDVTMRRESASLLSKIQQVADLILGSFVPLDPVSFSGYLEKEGLGIGFKHGPGAVAEGLKRWEKSHFPNWPHKLQAVFPYEFCGTVATNKEGERPPNHEVASRLIQVPKTTKGPRLIAAEPTSHQWCQQLVLRYLFDQCRVHFGTSFIDFKDQTKSGDMVLAASLDKSLATVDLSDASDRLTCWTVERLFRSNPSILVALHAARTRYIHDKVSEYPDFLSLRKFASQGTATTFPVMSLVMLFIALGSSLRNDEDVTWPNLRKYRAQVRVFGDDIILPAHGYERLIRAMTLLQLKVNTAKSYVHGYFRESCGTDGYLGYDVTPVKPKVLVADSPASCQAVVDNSNNLYLKGYWNASTACFDLLPARLRRGIRIVGPYDAGFRGVTSYSGGYEHHLAKRWNSRLHRDEVRVWTLSVRTEEHPRDGLSALLDFFASKHNPSFARTVSKFADVRKTRIGLQWEPSNSYSSLATEYGKGRFCRDDSSNRVFTSKLWSVWHRTFDVDADRSVP